MTTPTPEAAMRQALKNLLDACHEGRLTADAPSSWGYVNSLIESGEAALAQREAGAVPDGWKLVPVEPTQEMLRAVTRAVPQGPYDFAMMATWRVMLAAAPPCSQRCAAHV